MARGGRVVSDTVVFEYKAGPAPAPSSPASAPLPSLDIRRFSLLQRLQRLQGRLQMKIEPTDDKSQVVKVGVAFILLLHVDAYNTVHTNNNR